MFAVPWRKTILRHVDVAWVEKGKKNG